MPNRETRRPPSEWPDAHPEPVPAFEESLVWAAHPDVSQADLRGKPSSPSNLQWVVARTDESAGARTAVASLTTEGLVILTLLFLAPLFSELPKAVLAAIIIDAVVFGMIDLKEFSRLQRVSRVDFWIAVAALVGVLSAGVLFGIIIGIALSLGWLVYLSTRPAMPLLGREPGTQVFRDIDLNPADETFPASA